MNSLEVSTDGAKGEASIFEKFPRCCEGIGKLKDLQLKDTIGPEVQPVAQPIRRVPYHLRDKLSTKRERFPIPTIDKVLQDLNQTKFFSMLDLTSAYHQTELSPESRDITTFGTYKGLYQYKQLMFGISCAPEMYHFTKSCKSVTELIIFLMM